jgi:cytochrome P450
MATHHLTAFADVSAAFLDKNLVQLPDYERNNILENIVLQLHGDMHRQRRRLENPLFRRPSLTRFESGELPEIIDFFVKPGVENGHLDLIDLGHNIASVPAARISGVDFDWRDPAVLEDVMRMTKVFMDGASIADTKRDRSEVVKEVQAALTEFDTRFFGPSCAARLRSGDDAASAEGASRGEDLLSTLLPHMGRNGLDRSTVLREVAFFLEAGFATSTTALANCMSYLLDGSISADFRRRASEDVGFAQRCAAEALRLHPASHIKRRRAASDTEIGGVFVSEGDMVFLDLDAANTDSGVFGKDAAEFNPDRAVSSAARRFGLSFGGGIHTCIGRTLALGIVEDSPAEAPHGTDPGSGLYGTVPHLVHRLLGLGVYFDPARPAIRDQTTNRRKWLSMPLVLERAAALR